ncbi:hypothetical protein CW745_04390 [Psychromonas sp. psych-6C06]|uniref:hypothetical protein n=1 Tax=Psychromonas sp. psych-6C06 TaxID=2058089 RepID=UPI000C3302B5|nr:hypothetical protein [Psychromonas sp. psych-6C06]PKF62668.1 hypothetical protein CW745_04390 [Psychromonas sp. psych-6C06]
MNQVNYAFWIIMLVFVFAPLYLVVVSIVIEDETNRHKLFIFGGIIGCVWFSMLIFKQMNVEVVYGQALLDYWYATNPE